MFERLLPGKPGLAVCHQLFFGQRLFPLQLCYPFFIGRDYRRVAGIDNAVEQYFDLLFYLDDVGL
ncbi:hypothetical protein [Microbaculum marinisediminis]|uniref:Uncharacterized protein n=1 Tax=Microbaculum marinisediminis TaxID=2931392 RepID=A0AAW5QWU9_9HYPH|nr:hypothetical protein [Microbaculum sp. A6E488]MCT8970804.1 hypothetical protein [Microbaculum sp. A6E488]